LTGSPLPAWLRVLPGAVEISLYVQPGAKKTGVAGEHDGALKLRVLAPPVEGKANAAVLAFVAATCAVARSQLSLTAGELSRHKRIRIAAADADDIARRLLDAAA